MNVHELNKLLPPYVVAFKNDVYLKGKKVANIITNMEGGIEEIYGADTRTDDMIAKNSWRSELLSLPFIFGSEKDISRIV